MRQHGILKAWFERGFGFVMTEDRKQFFLHISNLVDCSILPAQGDGIEFEAAEPRKQGGLPQAIKAVITRPVIVRSAGKPEPLWAKADGK